MVNLPKTVYSPKKSTSANPKKRSGGCLALWANRGARNDTKLCPFASRPRTLKLYCKHNARLRAKDYPDDDYHLDGWA